MFIISSVFINWNSPVSDFHLSLSYLFFQIFIYYHQYVLLDSYFILLVIIYYYHYFVA